ncbi:hypothetical protein PsYK624_059100 [Phanerochaete sordida]|uniref:Uncharacterized protein n=1 Tax=Phanerochaete sordida TaxID=48140 RepID=A0A9P3LDD2_9APHY|nr:hypothetical protein PsYK624_059100 [Phanerochaete sordida]
MDWDHANLNPLDLRESCSKDDMGFILWCGASGAVSAAGETALTLAGGCTKVPSSTVRARVPGACRR